MDENSASAAELMALSLKTYLDNVIIIGRLTFGKGVGQSVYVNKERKLMVFVVNNYWNVREQNIMNAYISPDIYVESDNIEDYLMVIKKNP